MLLNLLTHTPFHVWVLMAFLLFNGYQACFTRTRSLFRLILVPSFFLWLDFTTVKALLGLEGPTLLAALLGLVAGFPIGAAVTRRRTIRADRARGLIQLPGDRITLVLILLNFVFQYGLHAAHALASESLRNHAGSMSAWMGLFPGIAFGRNLTFLCKYYRAETVPLRDSGQDSPG